MIQTVDGEAVGPHDVPVTVDQHDLVAVSDRQRDVAFGFIGVIVGDGEDLALGLQLDDDAVGLERRQPPRRFGVGRDLFGLIPDGL